MSALQESSTKYPLMIDKVAKSIFKNNEIGKEYTSRIISTILHEDYETIYQNIKLISEEISFSTHVIDSKSDIMLDNNSILVDVEINYFNGPTKNAQMNSYVFQLYLGQIKTFKDYPNIKKVVQIIIEDQDFFNLDEFVYNIVLMERKHHIEENEKIERFRINLDYLSKLSYTNIRKDELAYLLYPFVCGFDKLDKAYNELYKNDEFMKRMIDMAKKNASKQGFKLYFPLTDEEIKKLDEKYYIDKGIKQGLEQGLEKGLEQGLEKQKEMILRMHQENIPIETIVKISSLSVSEVEKIINEKE